MKSLNSQKCHLDECLSFLNLLIKQKQCQVQSEFEKFAEIGVVAKGCPLKRFLFYKSCE